MERAIAIIPARSGSKSILHKNLVKFNQKTLVRLATEVALASRLFNKVIITTDYQRHQLGIDGLGNTGYTQLLYSRRPDNLCEDKTPMIDVVKYVLNDFKGSEKFVWLLQPTSPFRTIKEMEHIDKMVRKGDYKSAISFVPVKDHSNRIYTYKDGEANRRRYCNYKNKQELAPELTRSGNYYVAQKEDILEFSTFENKPFYTYIMGNINPDTATHHEMIKSRTYGANIDSVEDLNWVKSCVRRGDVKV